MNEASPTEQEREREREGPPEQETQRAKARPGSAVDDDAPLARSETRGGKDRGLNQSCAQTYSRERARKRGREGERERREREQGYEKR